MFVTGKIEVFKNKKGYLTGVIKSFDKDGVLVAKEMVSVSIVDEKLAKKVVDGKTVTIDVTKGYLDLVHVELESESFNKFKVAIKEGKVVKVFPEDVKPTKKATKKSTK